MKTTFRKIAIAVVIHLLLLAPIHAQIGPEALKAEYDAATQSILQGRVKYGIGGLWALLGKIDPRTAPSDYWTVGNALVDFLHQLEGYSEEDQVLSKLYATNAANSDSPFFQRMQLNVGRHLAYAGKAPQAEKILRALTGNDARWVLNPDQREAARVLSTIELDRGNVGQAAIWMRRALVGTLVDKGAGTEEIADVLTHYAQYLARTRQLAEAANLIARLAPIYEKFYPRHSPKSLKYLGVLLDIFQKTGNFKGADWVYGRLKESAVVVDVVAEDIRQRLFFQDLYGQAIKTPATGNPALIARLQQVLVQFPAYREDPEARIRFSYFASLAGNLDLAEQLAAWPASDRPLALQLSTYKIVLEAYFAARRDRFSDSIALISKGLEGMEAFHLTFEAELSSHLPSIAYEERLVLGTILGLVTPHVSSHSEANTVFRLEQFLSRDKAKLSLSARVSRQALRSDLEREDVRTRDRLRDLRERILADATDRLMERATVPALYAPSKDNDYASLTRLEDIDEKITTADTEIKKSVPDLFKRSNAISIDLTAVQQLLKPNEALVIHAPLAGVGIASSCVTSNDAVFAFQRPSAAEARQLVVDAKLLSAALQANYAPSAQLDSTFPADNSFHLYQTFFGPIEACLAGKTHLLLAPDADLVALPWNALLSKPPADGPFNFRKAPWLARQFAISLLPSVGSLRQLRVNLPASRARSRFLGIGDPDFTGDSRLAVASMAPLFNARGAPNIEAIARLPRLPDAATELRDVADVLGIKQSELLLGDHATERNLRSRPLDDYKIVSFATHAIVPGELEGGTEPALILSPGADRKNTKNDGLLTANEIADLPLDANLVVLSACNTAGSDGTVAGRGLSGLADAFFFAGARAVVVTQWSVFSDAARQLGAGLVSRSTAPDAVGVADGLRQAMLNYISNAKDDYLAHPRFWAAYIIAGDGAVNPLSGSPHTDDAGKNIQVDWENLSLSPEDAEVMDVSGVMFGGANYAIGIKSPPPGEKRAGSYVASIDAKGGMKVEIRDSELAASRIVSLGSDIGILGYYPASCARCPQSTGNTSAVFRLLDQQLKERWKYVQQSAQWIFAKDIVRSREGFILVGFATDYSPQSQPSSILLTRISETGAASKQSRFIIPLKNPVVARGIVHGPKGEMLVAVTGTAETSSSNTPSMWTNPQTGTKRFQCSRDTSIILSIDPDTLEIQQRSVISSAKISRLKEAEGHIFASMGFTRDCQLEKNVRLVEFEADFQPKTLFESTSVNSLEISDFAVTDRHFILVGALFTFLPSALANETMSLDQMKNFRIPDLWDESIWDKADSIGNAAVITLGRDGRKQADRIFPDIRNRSLSAIAMRDGNHFVAVGSALGDVGWTIGLTLGDQLH